MRKNFPKKMITKELLTKFCDENKIFYFKSATLNYLMAAVYRFVNRDGKTSSKECLGFWEDQNNECSLCAFEEKCFKLSFGEEKTKYFKEHSKVVNEDEWI